MNSFIANPRVTCAKLKINQYPIPVPIIYDISYYYDNTQNQTVITIVGSNFRYFSTVKLGNKNIEIIYISSTIIQINVPRNLNAGIYSLYVSNDIFNSNSVNYTHVI